MYVYIVCIAYGVVSCACSIAEASKVPAAARPPTMRIDPPEVPQPATKWRKGITFDELVRSKIMPKVRRKSAVEEVRADVINHLFLGLHVARLSFSAAHRWFPLSHGNSVRFILQSFKVTRKHDGFSLLSAMPVLVDAPVPASFQP